MTLIAKNEESRTTSNHAVPLEPSSADRPLLSGLRRFAWPYAFTALLSVLILCIVYRLYAIDLSIPLHNLGDAIFYQALFKNFIETGHYNINPFLGAPGQGELYDFPVPHSTHLMGMAFLRMFTRNYGLVFNLYYLAAYPLAALTALYVLRRFRVSRPVAVVCSVLFAFQTFHLRRAEYHYVHAAYYLVPLTLLVSLWLCTGVPLFIFNKRLIPKPIWQGVISGLTCILIAGDNPYWLFFTGIFVVCGGLIGHFHFRHKRSIASAAILVVILTSAFVVNLSPNLLYRYRHGGNHLTDRPASDSETYGLKIIQMLAPASGHRIHWLSKWKDNYNQQAPLINENDTATLGIVGSVGFCILLGVFFAAHVRPLTYSLAVLNICAVLVGTIGGFGALFAFLVWPQYRGYNRISIFIGFLCLFAVALSLDWGFTRLASFKARAIYVAALVVILIAGLIDQIPSQHFISTRKSVEGQQRLWRGYFGGIESSLPSGSMVFQLPYLYYPQSPSPNNLGIYEELIPYLETKSLHWSHGSMAGREADQWNREVASEPIPQLVDTLAASGFSGILVDRFGYSDRGAALESQFRQVLHQDSLVSPDERYAFFSLVSTAQSLKDRYDASGLDKLRHPVYADMGDGCWPMETVKDQSWNWCNSQAELVLSNLSNQKRTIELQLKIRTAWSDLADVDVQGVGVDEKFTANNTGRIWKSVLVLPPGTSILRIRSDGRPVDAPGDPRHMIFMIQGLTLSESLIP